MSLHIDAKESDIAEIVLLPGDPLRAKFIADNFLENTHCYSELRNMLGFTGTYKGVKISVQGTGMGIPSISIYAHELIHQYGAKVLIRVGTCGSIHRDIEVKDVLLAMSASTDSNINRITFQGLDYAPTADARVGGIFSTDTFYNGQDYEVWRQHGILGAEMESSALYTLAAKANVKALSILTVSDNLVTNDFIPPEDRETRIKEMAQIALDTAVKI